MPTEPSGFSTVVTSAACVLAGTVMLLVTTGTRGMPGVILPLLTDLPVAAGIFAAAGGWGWLVFGRLIPNRAGPGLTVVTCIAGGLWVLATAMLAIGSVSSGCLTGYLWWPIVAAGWALGVFAARKQLRTAKLPTRVPAGSLLWVLVAAAAGLWLAGATIPPGLVGRATGDFYDVVSYHLQVPREYYEAERISFLPHNTYSNYPFGAEMLFLLAMCLKGGAYAGAYAAKFTHGLWAALAIAGVYCALPRRSVLGRRIAVALLATAPMGVYLGWLAFVEWSQLAYLAVALAWLGIWLEDRDWRAAALVGMAIGGGCATKYLSVGLLVGPVIAVMLAGCVTRPRYIKHCVIALVFCAAMFSPWLIRNTVNTGNPVFPLATGMLGNGPWDATQAARWDASHAPKPWNERPALFGRAVVDIRGFGIPLLLLSAGGILWTAIRWRHVSVTARICVAVIVLQVLVWAMATHMPGRFLIPAAVPMAILAGTLAATAIAAANRPDGDPTHATAKVVALAALVVVATAGAGLWGGCQAYHAEPPLGLLPDGQPYRGQSIRPETLWEIEPTYKALFPLLSDGDRLLQVGDVRPYNFPAGTAYASVWERGPLTQIAEQTQDPSEIMRHLHVEHSVTHIWINWSEIRRLRQTYGWWESVDEKLIDSLVAAGAVRIDLPNAATWAGRPVVEVLALPDQVR